MTSSVRLYAAIFYVCQVLLANCNAYPAADYYVPIPDVTVTIGGTISSVPVEYEQVSVPIVFDAPASLTYLDPSYPILPNYPLLPPQEFPPVIFIDDGGSNNDNSLLYLLLLLGRRNNNNNNCGYNCKCNNNQNCNTASCSCGCSGCSSCCNTFNVPIPYSGPVENTCGCNDNEYYTAKICETECGPVLSISFTQFDRD